MTTRSPGAAARDDGAEPRITLRRAGLRATPQRVAALDAFVAAAGQHLSVEEIWQRLGAEGAMDRSTAYRVLADLCAAGLLTAARFGDGVMRYEARSSAHHHAVCTRCGNTSHVRSQAVNNLATSLRRTSNFVLGDGPLLLEGHCVSCG